MIKNAIPFGDHNFMNGEPHLILVRQFLKEMFIATPTISIILWTKGLKGMKCP